MHGATIKVMFNIV